MFKDNEFSHIYSQAEHKMLIRNVNCASFKIKNDDSKLEEEKKTDEKYYQGLDVRQLDYNGFL